MTRHTAFVVAVLAIIACKGEQGEPGKSQSRSASYCNSSSVDASAGNSWTVSVTCNAPADIPIQGWCYEPAGLPSGAYLTAEGPTNWSNSSVAAGWSCTWAWSGGTQSPIAVKVEICCGTPG